MNEKQIELIIRSTYYRAINMAENPQANEHDHEGQISDQIAIARRYIQADQDLRQAMIRLEMEVKHD